MNNKNKIKASFIIVGIIFSAIVLKTNPASASSLSLSIPDNIKLQIMPTSQGAFNTVTTVPVVKTDNYSGYVLSMYAGAADADLADLFNSKDETARVRNLVLTGSASSITGAAFSDTNNATYNNMWAYAKNPNKLDNPDTLAFFALPTSTSEPATQQVATSSTATTGGMEGTGQEFPLTFAAKATLDLPAGSYGNTITFSAVVNPVNYSITYNPNSPDPTNLNPVSNMPPSDPISGITTGDLSIPLSSNIPIRTGYTFLGWDEDSTSTTAAYPASSNYLVDAAKDNTSRILYAIWEEKPQVSFDAAFAEADKTKIQLSPDESYYAMQDMDADICRYVTTPHDETGSTIQTIKLVDIRDNNIYSASKLLDEKCWMIDNLRLGDTSAITLSNTDTNMNATSWTLPASGSWAAESYTIAYINSAYKDTKTTSYGSGSGKIGVYYNYCAASAGTICTSHNSRDASYDICPKNWRMPIGGDSGEYKALYIAYNRNVTNFRSALSTPRSGRLSSDGLVEDQGSRGYFWSSTRSSSISMYYLRSSTNINVAITDGRYNGFSVRCVSSV